MVSAKTLVDTTLEEVDLESLLEDHNNYYSNCNISYLLGLVHFHLQVAAQCLDYSVLYHCLYVL